MQLAAGMDSRLVVGSWHAIGRSTAGQPFREVFCLSWAVCDGAPAGSWFNGALTKAAVGVLSI